MVLNTIFYAKGYRTLCLTIGQIEYKVYREYKLEHYKMDSLPIFILVIFLIRIIAINKLSKPRDKDQIQIFKHMDIIGMALAAKIAGLLPYNLWQHRSKCRRSKCLQRKYPGLHFII